MAWRPLRNIGLKLAALALGCILWYTVSGHVIERRLPAPVFYRNLPAPLQLTGDQMDTVNVQVRGDDNIVRPLAEGQLQVMVDLGDARPGTSIIPLRVDDVVAPSGVDVVMIDPGSVTVTLERTSQIDVAVSPTIEGQPVPGYAAGPARIEPGTVTVTGPESALHSAVTVITERVVLDGRTATFSQDVGVGVTDARLRVLKPRTVRITVPITKEP
ncbi:MAG TPA: CdaR family protein [Vicinamibacterales bacterium]|jgi:YbbR domain-containing protein|nr:CdaR family protein [Vicinamibacterales bacterium]